MEGKQLELEHLKAELKQLIYSQNISISDMKKVCAWILKAQNHFGYFSAFKVKNIKKDTRYSTIKNRATWISMHTIILFIQGNTKFISESVKQDNKGRKYLTLRMEYSNIPKTNGEKQKYNCHHIKDRKDNGNLQILTEECHQDVDRHKNYKRW